jgi:2-furoyl-CoA dehydrogenase large subunit
MNAFESKKPGPSVGTSISSRVEDGALLRGAGSYGDDMPIPPGTLSAAVLRSPHPHARITSIDTQPALAIEGVRDVLTGEDVQRWARPFPVGVRQPMEHWCLAVDKVRFVGEPVAVVVADDRYIAEDALEVIGVGYKPLPVAVESEAAIGPDAAVLHDGVGSNVIHDRDFDYGDTDAAFASATRSIVVKTRFPRSSCTPIECYFVLANYDQARGIYDVTSNFQGPFALHSVMARALNVPGNGLRLRTPPDSGGSFGIKQGILTYVVIMALAARKVGAPVKWVEDRLEHLQAASAGTNRVTTLEAAVADDGRIDALRYDQIEDCGAYLRAPEPATLYRMHGTLTGAYAIPNLAVRNRVVLTNKMPSGLNRGFGAPQVYYPLERLMDRIAAELGINPLDVRRRNLIPADAFPYRAAAGSLLDSGDYQSAIEKGVNEGGLEELIERRDEARAEGRLYGIGYATVVEPSISNMGYITTAMPPEARAKAGPKNGAVNTATITFGSLGEIYAHISSTPQGQGHRTVVTQTIADVLGADIHDIQVDATLDTGKDPWSIASGNYSSRFSGAVAGAVYLAAVKIRDRLAAIAAAQWNVDAERVRFAEGQVFVADGDESTTLKRLAGATHWAPGTLPDSETGGLRETAFWTPPELAAPDAADQINSSLCYGFIFDFCGVEVDRTTGSVRIDRYVTLHDPGRILNPQLVDGQVRGGFAQGLGMALLEELAYGDDGSFVSGTFADYLVATAVEVPEPRILHMETPSPLTPLGAKGIGEGNNMSTPVCIANGVADALGADDIELPMTPAKLRTLIGIDEPAPPEGQAESEVKTAAGGGSQLTASDSVEIPASPETVFDALLDSGTLAAIIPGCHALNETGDHSYRADVTIGVGMVRARFDATVALSNLDRPNSLQLSGSGTSSMGTATGTARVKLTETAAGNTRLEYDYEAAVDGKVASVGGRMLQSASAMIIGRIFSRLAERLNPNVARDSFWQRIKQWFQRGDSNR